MKIIKGASTHPAFDSRCFPFKRSSHSFSGGDQKYQGDCILCKMFLVLWRGRACPSLTRFTCLWHWKRETKPQGLPGLYGLDLGESAWLSFMGPDRHLSPWLSNSTVTTYISKENEKKPALECPSEEREQSLDAPRSLKEDVRVAGTLFLSGQMPSCCPRAWLQAVGILFCACPPLASRPPHSGPELFSPLRSDPWQKQQNGWELVNIAQHCLGQSFRDNEPLLSLSVPDTSVASHWKNSKIDPM